MLDTSVIIKALFSPSRRQAGTTYSREVTTHKTCAALLAALDEKGIEGIIPQCGIVEIAAVSSRLADAHAAEEICNEVEMSYQLVPEEQIIRTATKIAREPNRGVLRAFPGNARIGKRDSEPVQGVFSLRCPDAFRGWTFIRGYSSHLNSISLPMCSDPQSQS